MTTTLRRFARRRAAWTLAVAAAGIMSACTPAAYRIPDAEVRRLVSTPPELRGQSIEVVETTWRDDAPARPMEEPPPPPPPSPVSVYVGGSVSHRHHVHRTRAPARRSTYQPRRAERRASPGRVRVNEGPVEHGVPDHLEGGGVGPHARETADQSGSRSYRRDAGEDSAVSGKRLAALAIIAGVAVGVGLAATRGARYDGTIAVPSNHPVHVRYPDGWIETIPLNELNAADVRGAADVTIHGSSRHVRQLGRAPLDRAGFAYRLELGGAGTPLWPEEDSPVGPAGQLQLGYFFAEPIGLMGSLFVMGGDYEEGEFFASHVAVEAQLFPLDLGRLHPGLFAGVGSTYAAAGGGDFASLRRSAVSSQYGAMLDIELTTHLTLSARLQAITPVGGFDDGPTTFAFTLGMATF